MSDTPPPPPPDQGGWGGPPPPGPAYGPPRTNTKATAALITGILSLPLAACCSIFGLVGIAAIVLGRAAEKEIAASGGAESGAGMARAGWVMGIIGTVLGVIMLIVSIVLVSSGHGNFTFNSYSR